MDLAELFQHHGTDKGMHGYAGLYECLFGPRRNSIMRLLEVGIGSLDPAANFHMIPWKTNHHPEYRPGASLRAWRDWLPNALVYGMDPAPDTRIMDEPRIVTLQASSLDRDDILRVMPVVTGLFDVIVEDGSHWQPDQLRTLENLWPYLRIGGIYVVEDLLGEQMRENQASLLEAAPGSTWFFARFVHHDVLVLVKR